MERPRIVAFDFGETLARYDGTRLNWSEHYDFALARVARCCEIQPSAAQLQDAKDVLTRYNTRVVPRVHEVSSDAIMAEIFAAWQLEPDDRLDAATEAFFAYFRRGLQVYPDTVAALVKLRRRGFALAVLTDVAYGMPRRFVEQDLAQAGVLELLDCLLTSLDVGRRKPDPAGLLELAAFFASRPAQLAYVGNEPKDMEAAMRAGALPILVDRLGSTHADERVTTIRSLAEIEPALG